MLVPTDVVAKTSYGCERLSYAGVHVMALVSFHGFDSSLVLISSSFVFQFSWPIWVLLFSIGLDVL